MHNLKLHTRTDAKKAAVIWLREMSISVARHDNTPIFIQFWRDSVGLSVPLQYRQMNVYGHSRLDCK